MKRRINVFFHNLRELKRNKKLLYKIRFSILAVTFVLILAFGVKALGKSFAFYQSEVDLNLDVQTAMFVVEEGKMEFNVDLDKIVPSSQEYIYTFSISNFNEERRSDVDLEYSLDIQTTTNMPLSYKLYKDTMGSLDKIRSRELKQDEDGSWYNFFSVDGKYQFTYKENQTDLYYLVVDFPLKYKEILEYSDSVDNVKITIDSRQVI